MLVITPLLDNVYLQPPLSFATHLSTFEPISVVPKTPIGVDVGEDVGVAVGVFLGLELL